MAGSITTVAWCAVKDGRAFTGTKAEILGQICRMEIVEPERQLIVSFPGYKPTYLHYYGDSFTFEEAAKDAVQEVFRKLPTWGYDIYRKLAGD